MVTGDNKKEGFMPIQIKIGDNPIFLLSAEHHQNNYVVDGKKYSNQEFFNFVHHKYTLFLMEN